MIETEYKFGEVHSLADQIQPAEDHPQFHRIFENANGGAVLIALKAGQALSEHVAPAELMVNVIEGSIEFTMANKPHTINAGEFMLVGEGVPHSVVAKTDSKVMLVKVKA
ncbi:MAG: cupin domain-containing protein [Muribaculaceae bacterium]|nr:cupin domain-containing protein [Muribaculaceae bacterium]